MLTPQEIEVWYLLPIIRRELAIKLKQKGMTQKDIAKIMDITPASVSHYINNKRAMKFEIKIENKLLNYLVRQIELNPKNYPSALQTALKELANKEVVCKIHERLEKINECCGLCRRSK